MGDTLLTYLLGSSPSCKVLISPCLEEYYFDLMNINYNVSGILILLFINNITPKLCIATILYFFKFYYFYNF